jgi:hypothetical protein
MPEISRLDQKRSREELIGSQREELWDNLGTQVQTVCDKMKAYYQKELTVKRNDGNSTIRVMGRTVGQMGMGDMAVTPELEIRFDRTENKIIARRVDTQKVIGTYQIKADSAIEALGFVESNKFYAPLYLSEMLVIEEFLEISLDP